MVEAWDPSAREKFAAAAKIGVTVRVTKININVHTEKSSHWTTSRSPYFAQLVSESQVEMVKEPPASWLCYHPLTPVAELSPQTRYTACGRKIAVS